jgi:transglutaminase-like putative cysteine protease/uncharacterized membrane protein
LPLTPAQTWWLLATGMAAFLPLTLQVPAWLSAVAGAAFLWRAALAWFHQPLPTRWVLSLIALAGAAGVFLQYRTLFGQQAGVALLVIFMALKQLEARAPRDGLAIVLLAYFLTLTRFLEDQSIQTAATMLGTLVIATAALASLSDPLGKPRELLRLSGLMLVQALPFMLILFVLFPRVSGPLWGLPADAYSSLTGLSDDMSPGAISHLVQSDAIAFRAKFDGPPPPRHELYWRGPVLPHLDGRTWRPGNRAAAKDLPYRHSADSPSYAYTVTLEPHNKAWLFALEFADALPPDATVTADAQMLAKKPVRERIRYSLRSHTAVAHSPASTATLAEALQLPAGLNPRTLALGAQWRSEEPDALRRLDRAVAFMRDQRLLYTLRPPLMSQHVADEFLFDYQRGFCEHFSAAFVVLMRSAGVPARVVTGYQGGERNPVDDTWVIRQSDAHAWAEVWLAERGWVRIDPTAASAPARIEQDLASAVPAGDPLPFLAGPGFDFLRELRYRWWAANNTWNQWILGYNPQRQQDLLARLGMDSPDWRKMTAALAVLCGAVLLVLIGAMLWSLPRRDPVERQWARLSRRLTRRGLARQGWEGPQDYGRRLAVAFPAKTEEISRIVSLYAGLRYGTLSPELLTELRRRVAAFKP